MRPATQDSGSPSGAEVACAASVESCGGSVSELRRRMAVGVGWRRHDEWS